MYSSAYNYAAHEGPYHWTIQALLNRYELVSSDEALRHARYNYFDTAIKRGYPLSTLPEGIEKLTAEALQEAATNIPDKKSSFRNGGGQLRAEDRNSFSEWAKHRKKGIWGNLFSTSDVPEIIIDFPRKDIVTTEKLLTKYIESYNKKAEKSYLQALWKEAAPSSLEGSPRLSTAGRTIDQRQIRLDPENSKLIQSFDPKKQRWVPGPKIGKFLQDNYEWHLFDLLQTDDSLDTHAKKEETETVSFLDLMNHQAVDCDTLLDAGELRILISADPQKIGEMSTGQRWGSCMATNGENYGYVRHDIAEGTLVAYVIHKEDVEARYPMMRQLIKPYKSQNGDMIFVPAKIYGQMGRYSANTAAALGQSLVAFVAKHNDQVPAVDYSMAPSLYADGQATMVSLREDWHDETIIAALEAFQNGAIEEWMTEIEFNLNASQDGKKGRYGEDASVTARKQLKKLENILQNDDPLVGLPRIFYREQTRANIGVFAHPKAIEQAALSSRRLQSRKKIFQALKDNDQDAFCEYEEAIKNGNDYEEKDMLERIVTIAVLSSKSQDSNSSPIGMLERLTDYIEGEYDRFGALDYSCSEKLKFMHIMDGVLAKSSELTKEQIERFAKFATNGLMHTMEQQREIKVIDNTSYDDGHYEIRTNFEPIASEEEFAKRWIGIMRLLSKANVGLASEYAEKVKGFYPDKLAYTHQHIYAKELLSGAARPGVPSP